MNESSAVSEIYFAGGCFWGTQRLFQCIPGVTDTRCGYANGNPGIDPDYQRVCKGDTGYRETVYVAYDPQQVQLSQLLTAFFHVIDPTVEKQQGPDVGDQYQTGIYYTSEADGELIRAFAQKIKSQVPVFAVEIAPLSRFVAAEEYHQDYLLKNPTGYCHIPKLAFETIAQVISQPSSRD